MTQTVLTVFDVDRPGTSGRREAPRGGGGHAEPALVGSRVGEYRHRVVGTSEKPRLGCIGKVYRDEPNEPSNLALYLVR